MENIGIEQGKAGRQMCQKILIIRLSSIGDVIHCTPVASSIKAACSQCKITWLVGTVAADLIQENPYIDEIIIWPREKFDQYLREFKFKQAWAMWQELKRKMAGKSFDVVLDIHGLFLSGMITRLIKAKRRIGMSEAKELNWLFMNETGEPLGKHITQKYLGVLTCLGINKTDSNMSLFVSEPARQFASAFLQRHSVFFYEKIIIVIVGTTWSSKNWPPSFFEQVVIALAQNFKVILSGGRAEMAVGQDIMTKIGLPVINAIGRTTLLEMAALMERATLVIAGDTGPLHMAAALKIPTIGLFGPTNPEFYAPKNREHSSLVSNLPCAYCHKKQCPKAKEALCMFRITPEIVISKVYERVTLALDLQDNDHCLRSRRGWWHP